MRRFAETITRWLPTSAKDRIRATIGDYFRFNHTLTSGIAITVRRPTDFSTYSEIFVDGFYDTAIRDAVRGAGPALRLLDLGSNVGYFAHRVADLISREFPERRASTMTHITMVEAARDVADESRFRLSQNAGKLGDLEVIDGVVGKKEGFAELSTSYNYGYNSVVQSGTGRRRVPFVDLTDRLSSPFDLIKCDIEGAEEMFIDTYQAQLARQPRLMFELHHTLCDTARCDRLLRGMGFVGTTIFRNADISMEYYTR